MGSVHVGVWRLGLILLVGALPVRAGEPVNLTRHPAAERSAAWAPDGDRYVFESDRDGHWDLFLGHVASGDVRRLTDHPRDERYARWFPDGRQLLFESNREGHWNLYRLDVDTGQVTAVTNHPANERMADVSPDGTRVAFGSDRDGAFDLFVLTLADGSLQRLAPSPALDLWPRFDATGSRVVFFSRRDGEDDDLYLWTGDGIERLTTASHNDFCPTWAGSTLVHAANRLGRGRSQLQWIDADGRVLGVLTDDQGRATEPDASPDGRRLLYTSNRGGNDDIYLLDLPGSDGG